MNAPFIPTIIAALACPIMLAGCQSSPKTTPASSVAMGSSGGSTQQSASQNAPSNPDAASDEVTLTVHGMSCPLCATNVDKQLLKVRGVENVKVNLSTGRIRVQIDKSNPPAPSDLVKAINESGFTLIGQPEYQ